MNKFSLLCMFVIFMSFEAYPQEKLEGRVLNERSQPLGFVNVVLLSLPDSVFVEGTITGEDGFFSLGKTGDIVKMSFVGYHEKTVHVNELCDKIVLYENSNLLSEVIVKADLPKYKYSSGGIMANIKGTSLGDAGTASDVLRQLPLLKEEDGGFSVFGKGSPVYYINGRKVRDISELEQIKSENIKSVEIINNPGARYESSVGAVIKIKTLRPEGEGLGFSLYSDYFQFEKADLYEQLDVNYRNKNIEVFTTLRYGYDNYWNTGEISQTVFIDNVWSQNNMMRTDGREQSLKAVGGMNYKLDDDSFIGTRLQTTWGFYKKETTNIESLVFADGKYYDEWSNREDKDNEMLPTFDWNIFYTGKKGDWVIDVNADALWSGNKMYSSIMEKSAEFDDRIVKSANKVNNRLYAFRGIVGHPLWGGTLDGGIETSFISREDNYINVQQIIPSSFTMIKEHRFASFLEYERMLGFFNLRAGLRYEHLSLNYYDDNILNETQSKVYNQFFPNISMETRYNDINLQLSYNSKVKRPSFSQLSNNVFYGNRYTQQSGNPYLKPSVNHNFSLSGFWKFLLFSLSYNADNNAIIYSAEQLKEDETITRITFKNIDKLRTLTSYLSASCPIGIWTPQVAVGMRKQWLDVESNGVVFHLDKPIWNLSLYNSIKFPFGIMSNINLSWQSKGDYENVYLNTTQCILNISLSKSFIDGKLSLSLKGYDLLNGYRDGNLLYNNKTQFDILNRKDMTRLGLSVKYRFNISNNKYKGTNISKDSKTRL